MSVHSLKTRLERLEASSGGSLCLVPIPPPGDMLAGYELLPGDGRSLIVKRQRGETENDLLNCVKRLAEAERLSGVVVAFGIDHEGTSR